MPSDETYTNRTALRERAYADPRALESRRALYSYRRPALNLVGQVMSQLTDAPDGLAVDVGCGSGLYTQALRDHQPDQPVLALDLSQGMAAAACPPAAVADAMRLPLADRSCAIVMALHMLYHVPDPARAVAELYRVCRPGGRVIITGNAAADKAELAQLWHEASVTVTGTGEPFREQQVLDLDDMETLTAERFGSVTRIDLLGETVVPEPEPVLEWLDSTRGLRSLPAATFEAVLAAARRQLIAHLNTNGSFRIRNHIGLLIAGR
jgi:SAM-dependent methyltransferase